MVSLKKMSMKRLIMDAGAERVGLDAAIALGKALEEIGLNIAREAVDWAHHAGRRTVKERDIEKASEKLLGKL